jgi:pilus assembly protein CpaB
MRGARHAPAGRVTGARRAALLLGLALLLGGLAAADVARREAALDSRLAPLVPVVVADADLRPERRLRLSDLAIRRLPARYAPVGAAAVPGELVGRRLAVPVPRGGPVGLAQLSDPSASAGAPVGPGERAVDLVALGSPELVVAGARVDVLITHARDSGARPGTELALEDVEVLASAKAETAGAGESGSTRVAATLRVTVRQAVYLTAAQAFAREVRLLPRAAGDDGRVGRVAVGEGLR